MATMVFQQNKFERKEEETRVWKTRKDKWQGIERERGRKSEEGKQRQNLTPVVYRREECIVVLDTWVGSWISSFCQCQEVLSLLFREQTENREKNECLQDFERIMYVTNIWSTFGQVAICFSWPGNDTERHSKLGVSQEFTFPRWGISQKSEVINLTLLEVISRLSRVDNFSSWSIFHPSSLASTTPTPITMPGPISASVHTQRPTAARTLNCLNRYIIHTSDWQRQRLDSSLPEPLVRMVPVWSGHRLLVSILGTAKYSLEPPVSIFDNQS